MNISIKTTPAFDRKAAKLLSPEILEEFFDHIGQSSETGEVITGTGGVRKIRWQTGKNNKGKRVVQEFYTITRMICWFC